MKKKQELHNESGVMSLDGIGTIGVVLISLGIIAGLLFLLFGASKQLDAQQGLSTLRMNVQQMFTSSNNYEGIDDALAIKAGLIPKKMIRGNGLVNPWGGAITLAEGDDPSTFTITITAIPQEACTKLAAFQLENWHHIEVNGTAIGRQSSIVDAADACQESNTIIYTAR